MSSAGSVRFTGLFPDRAKHIIVYSFKSNIKKEAEAPFGITYLCGLVRAKVDSKRPPNTNPHK
jgi:hypothetical protein